MRRLKAEDHAKGLVKANGINKALSIATSRMGHSGPDFEQYLPHSDKNQISVFFPVDRTGKATKKAVKERMKIHGFWSHVTGIIKTQLKTK